MGKKNRMGKGLDELFSDNNDLTSQSAAPEGTPDSVTTVRLALLEPNKEQPRSAFDQEKLEELAKSIKENGVLQPILVRPLDNGGYQIVAGERRWRASRLAGLTEVPVYIKELDDRQTMQMALIENIQRQDLSPIEEALAYKSLMDTYGMTQQQLSEAVGKSRPAVANSLRLLNLCEPVRKMTDDGIISASHAKILSALDPETQERCANEIEEKSLSVRELEELINDIRTAEQKAKLPYTGDEMEKLRRSSLKKMRPFLKEFEISVNQSSRVRTKVKDEGDGSATVTLKLGRELDTEALLSRLASLLSDF
ncbi:MAG: ParB/RepB/Spo0J family partition protein [Ruminococcus sp.]|nr:ParB/RepB/Spo0J family partition protein [Ruminococcus sp.]